MKKAFVLFAVLSAFVLNAETFDCAGDQGECHYSLDDVNGYRAFCTCKSDGHLGMDVAFSAEEIAEHNLTVSFPESEDACLATLAAACKEDDNPETCKADYGRCTIYDDGKYECRCDTFIEDEGYEERNGTTEITVCTDVLKSVCNPDPAQCKKEDTDLCVKMISTVLKECYSDEISASEVDSMINAVLAGEWNNLSFDILQCCHDVTVRAGDENSYNCLSENSCEECHVYPESSGDSGDDSSESNDETSSESKSSDGCSMFVI